MSNHPNRQRPWLDRLPVVGWLRRGLRNALFRLVRRLTSADEGRDALARGLDGIYPRRTEVAPALDPTGPPPYPDLGSDARPPATVDGSGTVFITGRFRSGSTLLWNLFRHTNGFTAYYEPYNERRWFDPKTRGARTDPTHRHVSDYWAEYEGLAELGRHYREEWTRRNLYMDEHSWDPDLLAYTRLLIARARGRAALQCNRIDFRLAWFRRHFPAAKLVHLYRHPRDQWCSSLLGKPFPPDGSVAQFRKHDGFYLLAWAADLAQQFPFLDERRAEHPYQLFYYLWKLSYLFGRKYADHSLSMEALVADPEAELRALFQVVGVDPAGQDMAKLRSLVVTPELGKWKQYAGEDWFQRHESACEEVLADFLSGRGQTVSPPTTAPASADYETAETPPAAPPPLGFRERFALWRRQLRERMREHLEYDSFLCRKGAALAGLLGGSLLRACGKRHRAFRLWAAVHRRNYSRLADRVIGTRFRGCDLAALGAEHVARLGPTPATARFVQDPGRLLGARALVLKSPGPDEKGVLLLDYTFAFPLFARAFDLPAVARRYHLVLEPSWSGMCDLDILCYAGLDFPVFVESGEPRDTAFLAGLGSNLVPVPVAGNWWVDHRVARPLPGAVKDADLIMVSAWARFKRHRLVLAALARLRARGERLKAILVGYPVDLTMDDIYRLARYYGVADQVELHERLPPRDVNALFNRARVHVLWSRREGFNRAVIEGMFAGVPCVMRRGFNYGHPHAYVNERTGCFASERELPERLLWMVRNHEQFTPRDWVMENMSCQRGTAVLGDAIREKALAAGERWTRGLAVRVCQLDGMQYWDEEDRKRFEPDYAFLRSCLRG